MRSAGSRGAATCRPTSQRREPAASRPPRPPRAAPPSTGNASDRAQLMLYAFPSAQVRHVLNIAQVRASGPLLRMITFDADGTLYAVRRLAVLLTTRPLPADFCASCNGESRGVQTPDAAGPVLLRPFLRPVRTELTSSRTTE